MGIDQWEWEGMGILIVSPPTSSLKVIWKTENACASSVLTGH